jgi:hypothetical protein
VQARKFDCAQDDSGQSQPKSERREVQTRFRVWNLAKNQLFNVTWPKIFPPQKAKSHRFLK